MCERLLLYSCGYTWKLTVVYSVYRRDFTPKHLHAECDHGIADIAVDIRFVLCTEACPIYPDVTLKGI